MVEIKNGQGRVLLLDDFHRLLVAVGDQKIEAGPGKKGILQGPAKITVIGQQNFLPDQHGRILPFPALFSVASSAESVGRG
jgi:hypothetical protein